MTNFAIYYRTKFRHDIDQFLSAIPDKSRFHEDNQNKHSFSIQYERLSKDFDHLDFLSKSDKENFGVALFFTVLIDMVCYTHYNQHYHEFNELTRYPKFIGNCPSGCNYHYHPSDIFSAMNFSRTKQIDNLSTERLEFYEKFNEAIPIIEKEMRDFLKGHLSDIDGQDFWERCKSEFPYRLKTESSKE
jgi:hypothetical protein